MIKLSTVDVQFGDDTKGSFRSDEKMFEVISGIIFLDLRRHIQNITIWKYNFQSSNMWPK